MADTPSFQPFRKALGQVFEGWYAVTPAVQDNDGHGMEPPETTVVYLPTLQAPRSCVAFTLKSDSDPADVQASCREGVQERMSKEEQHRDEKRCPAIPRAEERTNADTAADRKVCEPTRQGPFDLILVPGEYKAIRN
jgi:hypothetical protein